MTRDPDLAGSGNHGGARLPFEVHTESELERALKFNPKIVGVNNRDLSRFTTDLAITETLFPMIPKGIFRISESGIFNLEDAARARDAGADAVLIGQALMRARIRRSLSERFISYRPKRGSRVDSARG